MQYLSTAQFGLACQIYLKLAYPDGADSIPPKKQVFLHLCAEQALADFLPPPDAPELCQEISRNDGVTRGYALRLGSVHFPHLKLKVQEVDHNGASAWVFTVDTHDAFSKTSVNPPDGHPDAEAWIALQRTNRALKEQIETAWQDVGLTTLNSLLRSDLVT